MKSSEYGLSFSAYFLLSWIKVKNISFIFYSRWIFLALFWIS